MPVYAVGFFGSKEHPISFLTPKGKWTALCTSAATFTDREKAEEHASKTHMPAAVRAKVKVQQVAP